MPIWSSNASAVGSFTASAGSTIVWQQLSSFTENDGTGIAFGNDFVLRVHDQYPMLVSDTRPAYILDDSETP